MKKAEHVTTHLAGKGVSGKGMESCPDSSYRRETHLDTTLGSSHPCSNKPQQHTKPNQTQPKAALPASNPKLGTMSTVPWKAPAQAEVALVTAAGSALAPSPWGAAILAARTEGTSREP